MSLDEQIAETQRRLEALREKKRVEEKNALGKNRKAIGDLFKAERLDTVDVEVWRKALPKVKALLGMAAESESDPPAVPASDAKAEPSAAVPPSKGAGKAEAQPEPEPVA
ncbi:MULTISPECIES: hypothetical protein [Paraburkholderia]|uniref:Uncharacterized protein n=1 Tax=Paraburkholderia madseniana TaxID=2599607 RepID=A0AAP5EZB6_9BURK|nr:MULTISPECIES: hypothetical protein [Paraburkholderia]MCX4151006.1 hypothetical protein [Paraburkholderia madseniana]MCX4176646.1 hypothetical protein [Paraburkholderia madseniana]MDN7153938.1 hypothetical protein [Paraburkholderia sp. WS6]MDQ6412820.1 hypothetical protein [Paraburkholderia madseniana]MDQ6464637.1 hypothetical protein [Paraburkholderia madseniana]